MRHNAFVLGKRFVSNNISNFSRIASAFSKSYSRLFLYSDSSNWALDQEAKGLLTTCKNLKVNAFAASSVQPWMKQCVHYHSHFTLLDGSIYDTRHRLSFDYFHGLPKNDKTFEKCYQALQEHHKRIARIRVSQSQIENLVLSSGIDKEKVFRIPIAIPDNVFSLQTSGSRISVRRKLGISEDAFVIGSFQKDGIGWSEGMEPKLIKGPDIFLKSLALLRDSIPHLHILLTGPARGYVRKGLDELGISYTHRFLPNEREVWKFYHALDVYIIASREEGGPKALFESMASGIPVVTTRVGQAMDLVEDGVNAYAVESEDYEGIARFVKLLAKDSERRKTIVAGGRELSLRNTLSQQTEMWKSYLTGFVNF